MNDNFNYSIKHVGGRIKFQLMFKLPNHGHRYTLSEKNITVANFKVRCVGTFLSAVYEALSGIINYYRAKAGLPNKLFDCRIYFKIFNNLMFFYGSMPLELSNRIFPGMEREAINDKLDEAASMIGIDEQLEGGCQMFADALKEHVAAQE